MEFPATRRSLKASSSLAAIDPVLQVARREAIEKSCKARVIDRHRFKVGESSYALRSWDVWPQRNLCGFAFRQRLLRFSLEKIVDEPPARLGIGTVCNEYDAVRDQERPHSVVVGINNPDRLPFKTRHVRVVRIR